MFLKLGDWVDLFNKSLQVYDYDWGLRDDFMGSVSLELDRLQPGEATDLVLTLGEAGEVGDRENSYLNGIFI